MRDRQTQRHIRQAGRHQYGRLDARGEVLDVDVLERAEHGFVPFVQRIPQHKVVEHLVVGALCGAELPDAAVVGEERVDGWVWLRRARGARVGV